MPTKSHEQKINQLEEEYCKKGFRCKKNFPLFDPRQNNFALIDLVCFKENSARAFEIEVTGKQAVKNAGDLRRFKETFKNAKICQLTTDMTLEDCPDFSKKANAVVRRVNV
jgi:hypothetical protein